VLVFASSGSASAFNGGIRQPTPRHLGCRRRRFSGNAVNRGAGWCAGGLTDFLKRVFHQSAGYFMPGLCEGGWAG